MLILFDPLVSKIMISLPVSPSRAIILLLTQIIQINLHHKSSVVQGEKTSNHFMNHLLREGLNRHIREPLIHVFLSQKEIVMKHAINECSKLGNCNVFFLIYLFNHAGESLLIGKLLR